MSRESQRSVITRLGIKPKNRIALLNSPKGYTSILAKLPPGVSFSTRVAGAPFDIVQAFYDDKRTLKADLSRLRRAIRPNGKIWICWRKGLVTELNRDLVMELGEKARLESVAACAID